MTRFAHRHGAVHLYSAASHADRAGACCGWGLVIQTPHRRIERLGGQTLGDPREMELIALVHGLNDWRTRREAVSIHCSAALYRALCSGRPWDRRPVGGQAALNDALRRHREVQWRHPVPRIITPLESAHRARRSRAEALAYCGALEIQVRLPRAA